MAASPDCSFFPPIGAGISDAELSSNEVLQLWLSGVRISHARRQALSQRLMVEASSTDDPEPIHEVVIALNLRVALAVARRYSGRGVDREDLEQAACEGLVKAVHRYDPDQQHDLLTYAVPTVRGEVLRHFRDRSWAVRPPRRVQEIQGRIRRETDALAAAGGCEPEPEEVRLAVGVSAADFTEASSARGCFRPTSLDQPLETGSSTSLGDSIATDVDGFGPAEARAVLMRASAALDGRQARLIYLRFFEDWTQREIGVEFAVTQATISRWLQEALAALREGLAARGVEGEASPGRLDPASSDVA